MLGIKSDTVKYHCLYTQEAVIFQTPGLSFLLAWYQSVNLLQSECMFSAEPDMFVRQSELAVCLLRTLDDNAGKPIL